MKAWRKQEHTQARLLAAWFLVAVLALGVFGTRAAYYLLAAFASAGVDDRRISLLSARAVGLDRVRGLLIVVVRQ